MRAPVEVYGPDKDLIGHLQGVDLDAPGRQVVFASTIGLRFALDKVYRNREVDRMRFAHTRVSKGEILAGLGIPPDAQETVDPARDAIRFRWVVLQADDLEVCEILFDDPRFEPDGKRCAAAAAEDRWWQHRRREGPYHSGGIVPSTKVPAPVEAAIEKSRKELSEFAKAYKGSLIDDIATTDFGLTSSSLRGSTDRRHGLSSLTNATAGLSKIGVDLAKAMDRSAMGAILGKVR